MFLQEKFDNLLSLVLKKVLTGDVESFCVSVDEKRKAKHSPEVIYDIVKEEGLYV